MTPEVAIDLWRARFGDRWTTTEEAVYVLNDPDWRKILYLCGRKIEHAYPSISPDMQHTVYRLIPEKDSNGNS